MKRRSADEPETNPLFITPQEMADEISRVFGRPVSVATVYNYLRAGIIPADHSGQHPVMHRKDWETWLAGGKSACHWLAQPRPSEQTTRGGWQTERRPQQLRISVNGVDVAVLEETAEKKGGLSAIK